MSVARTLGATRVKLVQDVFGGQVMGVRLDFGKYGKSDWEIHEQIMRFREAMRVYQGVELEPKLGGRVNVSFSSEAYVRRSI